MTEEIFNSMIAGVLPDAGNDSAAMVHMAAEEALSESRVHVAMARHAGSVYYLAVPSRLLASAPGFESRLAAALPTHPQHIGDAAYVEQHGLFAVAVIKHGATLRVICNDPGSVAEACTVEGLPVVDVDEATPWIFESKFTAKRGQRDKFERRAFAVAASWLVAASVIFLTAAGAAGYLSVSTKNDQVKSIDIDDLLKKSIVASPALGDLKRLRELSATLVEAGGWIVSYENKGGAEKYEIRLPSWASRKTIEGLGSDVEIEFDDETQSLKGIKK